MANPSHVLLVRAGRNALEAYRRSNPKDKLDLTCADLSGCDLSQPLRRGFSALPLDGLSHADLGGANLEGATLCSINFRGANLTGAVLRHADLSSANLSRAVLREADLGYANLSGANLFLADLTKAALDEANVAGATMECRTLNAARLTKMDLRGRNFRGVDCRKAVFDNSDMSGASLVGADLRGASVRNVNWGSLSASGARLNRLNLRDVNLRDSDLSHANLTEADLTDADLTRADLSWARLSNCVAKDAIARFTRFEGAKCVYADFSGSSLTNAVLRTADFSHTTFQGCDLEGVDATDANLQEADLSNTNLINADLRGAKLDRARMRAARIVGATLIGTSLERTDLQDSTLINSTLERATLRGSDLRGTLFNKCYLAETQFAEARCGDSVFVAMDLSLALGLDRIEHTFPSSIAVDALYNAEEPLPAEFLAGCGVPEQLLTFLPSLTSSPIEFYSCFIAYSHQDEEFCRRLYSALRAYGLRTWFAPEDLKAGRKLYEQIDQAIRVHDKLLVVLSEHSITSRWVITEVGRARQRETRECRRVLFPIRIIPYESLSSWECFDADTGNDVARDIREYFIPDFQGWRDRDRFQDSFFRLLEDLRADAAQCEKPSDGSS